MKSEVNFYISRQSIELVCLLTPVAARFRSLVL